MVKTHKKATGMTHTSATGRDPRKTKAAFSIGMNQNWMSPWTARRVIATTAATRAMASEKPTVKTIAGLRADVRAIGAISPPRTPITPTTTSPVIRS